MKYGDVLGSYYVMIFYIKKMRELNLPGINETLIAKLNYNSKLCNFCLHLYDLNQNQVITEFLSNITFFSMASY